MFGDLFFYAFFFCRAVKLHTTFALSLDGRAHCTEGDHPPRLGPIWATGHQGSVDCTMIDKILSRAGTQDVLIVLSASDLETVIRNVVSELLAERQEATADVKVSRAATAKRLHKTPMTLTRWEQAGKIHPIKIGRSIYYMESEVKLIEAGKK